MVKHRRSETVTNQQSRIEVLVEGAGPPVALLPSYGRDGVVDFDDFAGQVAADGYTVIRPQPRGAAGSTGVMDDVSLTDLGADVASALRATAHGPAVLLGHAFGNIVARVVAAVWPESVRAVGLLAASGSCPPPDIRDTPTIAGDLTAPEAVRLDALRRGFFAPGHDPHAWLTGWYPDVLAMEVAAVPRGDLRKNSFWSAGTARLIEVIPEFDPFKPQDQWLELRDENGGRLTTRIVAGAGHALFPEEPVGLLDALLPVLRRLCHPGIAPGPTHTPPLSAGNGAGS
ncbi:alpha/beta fold hydrolase [Streptomyces bauhiniae]|uniref:Alpha/beta hydrolase n=1 Tax=Streptomyces bauhiniae TaxID=2340725 RepID=A0A7K3QVL7_9ACTN|nr:alpha/beta hydrolase [Streptomyces bauhiniae]NEB93957.1 alpha/beta hydrolase [Streptomyces bauhiniae]